MCPDHTTPYVFITFLELLAHVIFLNTGLICTHGRTGVRLVTPLVAALAQSGPKL
jgi:hypothetical protein